MKAADLLKLSSSCNNELDYESSNICDNNVIAVFDNIAVQQFKKNKSNHSTIEYTNKSSAVPCLPSCSRRTVRHLFLDDITLQEESADCNVKIAQIPYVAWDADLDAAMEGTNSSRRHEEGHVTVSAMPVIGRVASVPFHVSYDHTIISLREFLLSNQSQWRSKSVVGKASIQLNQRLASMCVGTELEEPAGGGSGSTDGVVGSGSGESNAPGPSELTVSVPAPPAVTGTAAAASPVFSLSLLSKDEKVRAIFVCMCVYLCVCV